MYKVLIYTHTLHTLKALYFVDFSIKMSEIHRSAHKVSEI